MWLRRLGCCQHHQGHHGRSAHATASARRNGSYTALLAAEADIHPSMAMCKLRPGGAIVRPPYPQVTGAFTGRCLMRPGRWRTRGMAPPGAREHDPSGTACTGGPGHTQTRFTVPNRST